MKAQTPNLALLTCLILCEGHHHPLLASWKIWESFLTAHLIQSLVLWILAFPCHSRLPTSLYHRLQRPCPSRHHLSSGPLQWLLTSLNHSWPLDFHSSRASRMIFAKVKSHCAAFTLTPLLLKIQLKPSQSLDSLAPVKSSHLPIVLWVLVTLVAFCSSNTSCSLDHSSFLFACLPLIIFGSQDILPLPEGSLL